ncbi:MAG: 16S rRNA (cytosine(967)-C(5))-methyltransferase RsmB [Candidatus Cloacimonadota bacterium]|nr:16S rRNA (cytosine(967)-C(5))-methyltransferase RsmB [Candidatus Cloacimonadota bacterium]
MNVREITFSALNSVLIKNQSSEEVLAKFTQKYNLLENEKRLFYALTKGVLKRKIFLDFLIKSLVQKRSFSAIDSQIKNFLRLGLYQIIYMNSIPDYASVNEMVAICNQHYNSKLCKFLNAILRSYIRERDSIKLPDDCQAHYLSIKHSFPQYMIESWLSEYGTENTIKMCEYFNRPANLHLRFDPDKISFEDFAEHLIKENVKFSRSKFFPYIVKLMSNFHFLDDPLFQKGYYYIQDESTTLPVMLLAPKEGDKILDLCAAPGGKTLLISAIIHNKGKIIANDIDKNRMRLLKENTQRIRCRNIEFSEKDATTFSVDSKFDKILLDVPCSGWGAMQKKPEIRFQSRNRLKSLIPLQKRILDNASNLVRNNGIIVYSTCTLNPDENEKQIENFLEFHNEFYLEKPDNFVEKSLITDSYVKSCPFKHNIDGTFSALLRKR